MPGRKLLKKWSNVSKWYSVIVDWKVQNSVNSKSNASNSLLFQSGECLVCSLKLCEQIFTSNQGLLMFECGKLRPMHTSSFSLTFFLLAYRKFAQFFYDKCFVEKTDTPVLKANLPIFLDQFNYNRFFL